MAEVNRIRRPVYELMRNRPSKPTTSILYAFDVNFKRVCPPFDGGFFMPSKEAREKYNGKRKEERAAQKLEAHKKVVGWKDEKSKARSWAFIVYPESAPEEWRDILQMTGLQFAISPLHDCDKDPTEEEKKAHWHVIAVWRNPTTGATVRRITESVKAPVPIPLNDMKGYYRYLTHKENPEKHQYDEKDITVINGFNILDFVDKTKSEVNAYKRTIQRLILEMGITEYAVLMIYLDEQDMYDEYDIASSHTYFFDKFIASIRNMHKEEVQRYDRKEKECREDSESD
jgi:hypothetical protein